jgi:hypothetical protein
MGGAFQKISHADHESQSKAATLSPAQDHRGETPLNLQKQIIPGGAAKNPPPSALFPGMAFQTSGKILTWIFMQPPSPSKQSHLHRQGKYGPHRREPPVHKELESPLPKIPEPPSGGGEKAIHPGGTSPLPKERGLLTMQPLVFVELRGVVGVEKSTEAVQKTPPHRRGSLHQLHIRGNKKDPRYPGADIPGGTAPGTAAQKVLPSHLAPYLQKVFPFEASFQKGLFRSSPSGEIPHLSSRKGAPSRKEREDLQKVGLSRSILSGDEGKPRREAILPIPKIPEIAQSQDTDMHEAPRGTTPGSSPR